MVMYRCLKCGKTSRAKKSSLCKTPGCYGYTISTCRHTAQLAKQFYLMGFQLSFSEAYTSLVIAAEDEKDAAPNGWKVISACVEFAKKYSPDVFPALPENWRYYDPESNENFCRLVYFYFEAYKPTEKKYIYRELHGIVKELYDWAVLYSDSNAHIIHSFAGMI